MNAVQIDSNRWNMEGYDVTEGERDPKKSTIISGIENNMWYTEGYEAATEGTRKNAKSMIADVINGKTRPRRYENTEITSPEK